MCCNIPEPEQEGSIKTNLTLLYKVSFGLTYKKSAC